MKHLPLLSLALLLASCTPTLPSQHNGENVSSQASLSSSSQKETKELTAAKWKEVNNEYLSVYKKEGYDAAAAFLKPLLDSSQLPPTTTVSYEDTLLSFALPYNPQWGWHEFQLSPYWDETIPKGITFGPLHGMEGGIGRDCRLSTGDRRTLADAAKETDPTCDISKGTCQSPDVTMMQKTVGEHEVLFTQNGSFGTTSAELQGKHENFIFWCWEGPLEEMLKSVQVK